MKRLILLVAIALCSISSVFKTETILKNNYSIMPFPCYSGVIAFKDKTVNKVGFIQSASDAIICIYPQFDDVYITDITKNNLMVRVVKNGKYGAVNGEYGYIAVECIYDKMELYKNGKALVTLNGETFYINTKGKRI